MEILPRRAAVQTITADFEKAAWAAARQTLPGVRMVGCHFHWTQAIWRRVQEAGLQTRYNDERQTYEIVRQVLALPFLPVQEVPGAFQYIKTLTDDKDDRLGDLLTYIERNWADSSTFPVPTWNVFRVVTRTNNDCEGWHRRLNHYARDATPPFYVLVPLLFEEAKKVPLQRQMVTEGTLSRLQRREVRERQERYNTLWDDYEDGALNGIELLCEIARICGPSRL